MSLLIISLIEVENFRFCQEKKLEVVDADNAFPTSKAQYETRSDRYK